MANEYGVPGDVEQKLRRRYGECAYCHKPLKLYPHAKGTPRDKATIEHLNWDGPFYWSDGLKAEDLVVCCGSCNSSRKQKKLLDWFKSDYCMKNGVSIHSIAEPVREYVLRDFIKRQRWIFAKTMPEIPHEYVVRDALSENDVEVFDLMRDHIAEHGYTAPFGSKTYTYLKIGAHKYWMIDNILNRADSRF